VNGTEPRNSVTDGDAQTLGRVEGNIARRDKASGVRAPGVDGRVALTTMSKRQPGRSSQLLLPLDSNRGAASMLNEPKRRDEQMAAGKSDHLIVPLKRGNSRGGKGVAPSRGDELSPSVHRRGNMVPERLIHITARLENFNSWRVLKRWWGAACVNGARPVLRGAGVSNC
jgi:hypothetical protein